jgi:UDPglucose--hexose-1-phosphate uridylyltransferase
MFKQLLTKPDGRSLRLYGRRPIEVSGEAPSPLPGPFEPNAHLRWHPLRGEWIAYATHRQHRTFLPPPAYNPLAPTIDPSQPTELPEGEHDAAAARTFFRRSPGLPTIGRCSPSIPGRHVGCG